METLIYEKVLAIVLKLHNSHVLKLGYLWVHIKHYNEYTLINNCIKLNTELAEIVLK